MKRASFDIDAATERLRKADQDARDRGPVRFVKHVPAPAVKVRARPGGLPCECVDCGFKIALACGRGARLKTRSCQNCGSERRRDGSGGYRPSWWVLQQSKAWQQRLDEESGRAAHRRILASDVGSQS